MCRHRAEASIIRLVCQRVKNFMDYRRRETETVTTTIFLATSPRDDFCVGCDARSVFLSMELSAEMSRTDVSSLLKGVETGALHLQDPGGGERRICLRSLFQNSNKEEKK